jgi:hypothetical protein
MNHVIMQNRRRGWLRGLPGGPDRRTRHGLRPVVLALEDRRLLASLAVTNTSASGSGSLAAAIGTANGNDQANTITFQGSIWNTPQTITLGGIALVLGDTGGTQTITGPAAGVTLSGGGHSDVFRVYPGVTATLSGLTITDGTGFSRGSGVTSGGGVYNLGTVTLTNCTITGNSANIGGAVYNNYGTATLTNCTLSDNSVTPYKIKTYYGYNYSGGVGGGIDSFGTLTLTNCTISGNSSSVDGGGVVADGTATLTNCTISDNSALVRGGVVNYGTETLTNCTISGNQAGHGGGVYNARTATLTNCTISGNSTNAYGYGGGMDNTGTATLTDTIVAGNTGPSSAASDIAGTGSVTGSHNLIGTGGSGGLTNGQNGNIVLTSLTGLGLAPLAFYGGPTQTMALLPGSAAIGKGIAVSGVTTDQRGFPLDSPIDIGAFQAQPSTGKMVVNSTADGSGNQPGKLDLRGAVDLADVLTGAQTITFDPTVFAKAQTIVLTAGPIELSQTSGLETITGPAAGVTISGGGTSGVFQVNAGVTATLSGLTITDGNSTVGGGVDNAGTVTLTNCTISGNHAYEFFVNSGGGGVFNNGTATLTNCTLSGNSAEVGGGVDNFGTATFTNCTLSGNSASTGGGGVNNGGTGTAALTNCTLSGNSAEVGGGVYIGANAKTTLANCTLSGNSASAGGGVNNGGAGTATLTNCTLSGNSASFGGGVYNDGTATLTNCTLSGNSALESGGGVFNDGTETLTNCTLSGNSADDAAGGGLVNDDMATLTGCTLSGNSAHNDGGGVYNYGTATFTNCTISGNSASTNGGGVYNDGTATFTNCTIKGNFASFGGGVQNTGKTTLTNCTLSGNSAFNGGGGVNNGGTGTATFSGCTLSGNFASFGGGVNIGANATTTLATCTLSGNSAQTGGGMEIFGKATLTNCTLSGNAAFNGGGVYNVGTGTATLTDCTLNGNTVARYGSYSLGGALFDKGTATLTNCTIAGNSAGTSGGGIEAQGTVTITFSTFSGNQATYGGAIDNNFGQYTVTVEDSILAGDSAPTGPEFCNSVTSAGHNLVAEIDGSSGWVSSDLTGTAAQPLNALLAVLGQYGGPTQTIALLPGSPTIGTGIAVSGVTTDQRGVTRPSTGVDIGAFQSQGFTLTPVSGSTPQSALIDATFANALGVTVTAKDSLEPVAGGVIAFAAPSSGATATLSGATAKIGSNGVASVKATANNTAGTYSVTASAEGAAAPASFTLTNIVYQPVFSGLTNHTIIYGTSSVTVSGTIAAGTHVPTGDDVSVTLNGVAQQALIGATGSFSTTFATAALGVAHSPYTVTYVFKAQGVFLGTSGTSLLTVNPAPLTVTAANTSKIYGSAVPALTYTYTGLVNGDKSATFTGSLATTATASSNVGTYPITQGTLAATGNYTIGTFKPGTLTITKANQTITWANPAAIVYGTTLGATQLDAKVSVVGPAPAGAVTYSPVSGTVLKAGAGQKLTVTVAATTDYNAATDSVAITVNPAPLTVTANNESMTAGSPVPTLAYTYTGLVNGDKSAVFTGSLATTATSSSPVGTYPITEGTLAATGNYTIGTFKPGTLTVQSAAQAIPADFNGKTPDPTLASTGAGLTTNGSVNGQAVPRVTLSSPQWRSRRLWPAQSIRSSPAQRSARALVTTRLLMPTSH